MIQIPDNFTDCVNMGARTLNPKDQQESAQTIKAALAVCQTLQKMAGKNGLSMNELAARLIIESRNQPEQ